MCNIRRTMGVSTGVFVLQVAAGCGSRLAADYEIRVDRPHGQPRHVCETASFASGEKFRLRVTTHEDCYLYIFNKGTSGTYRVLFPHPKINEGSNYVAGWRHIIIPPVGAYQFDATPGVETVIMCLAAKRVPELERIVHGRETDPARIEKVLHELEAQGKRRARFRKIHHSGHTQVVLESPNPEAIMVNIVRLEHRPLGW